MHVLGCIAIGCGGAVFLLNLTLYGWRAAVMRRLAPCDADDRPGVVNAAVAFLQEYLALVAVIILLPLGRFRARSRSGGGSRGPVILLHGWGVNRGALLLLQRRLLRDGWSPVCCVESSPWCADFEAAASRLRACLDSLAASERRPVTCIAHGAGGLVLRYCARRYPAPSLRRLVTLGTPQAGTEVARALGPVLGDLVPGSKFLRTLNAADHVPQQFDAIAVHSPFDATILPPDNALYPGAFNIRVNAVGHYWLLFSPSLYRLLAENLAAPL